MPIPTPKPSSPIPFQRNRAQTFDQAWPPSNHPSKGGSFLPLQSISRSPSPGLLTKHFKDLKDVEDPVYTPCNTDGPLHVVDTMRLQVVRDEDENTLGMRVVDVHNTMGTDANIYAPLPIGETGAGIAFSVASPQAMQAAYMRANQITGSQRIMGIMFAPPQAQGKARDVDWSFLEPVKDRDRDSIRDPWTGRFDGVDPTRAQPGENTKPINLFKFGESSKSKITYQTSESDDSFKSMNDQIAELTSKSKTNHTTESETYQTAESDEPEAEDTGVKNHSLIAMMLKDQQDDE
ncbi:hypothetical protein FLONG3_5234 [Fusarium longipes]|uniref:Uncharacterized protein n=1 Tax=Fusarium longipes TaxID=694270 RepID=A0A395SWZ0_9HYPO|nr:hypothetical protein FLONG3_5234 [Fusarium longipes]